MRAFQRHRCNEKDETGADDDAKDDGKKSKKKKKMSLAEFHAAEPTKATGFCFPTIMYGLSPQ